MVSVDGALVNCGEMARFASPDEVGVPNGEAAHSSIPPELPGSAVTATNSIMEVSKENKLLKRLRMVMGVLEDGMPYIT